MTPGPKPKPGEVAAAQGNPGHRPVVTASAPSGGAVAPSRVGDAPEWLTVRGREIWCSVTMRAATLGYIRSTDADVLARYCDHVDRWLALREKVNAEGEAINTKSAHVEMLRVNPRFRAMMQLEERMTSIEDRFGFSPSARQSMLSRYDPTRDAASDAISRPTLDQPTTPIPSPLGLFSPVAPPSRPN